MSRLVCISMFISFWVIQTSSPAFNCLIPCKYQLKTSSVFYEPNKCSDKTKPAKVCSVELQFNYANQFATILRDPQEALPSMFDNHIRLLTNLVIKIYLKHGDVYYTFTHYCSVNPNCTKVFLSNTFNKYRTYPYVMLVEELRRLLQLNNELSTSLSSINCLNKKNISTVCNSGRCYADESPYTIYTERDCAIDDVDIPAPLLITVPNTNLWAEFYFHFECYWSLCNDEILVEDIKSTIAIALNPSMTTISRTIYTNQPTKMVATSTKNMVVTSTTKSMIEKTDTITQIYSSTSNYRTISSVVLILRLSWPLICFLCFS